MLPSFLVGAQGCSSLGGGKGVGKSCTTLLENPAKLCLSGEDHGRGTCGESRSAHQEQPSPSDMPSVQSGTLLFRKTASADHHTLIQFSTGRKPGGKTGLQHLRVFWRFLFPESGYRNSSNPSLSTQTDWQNLELAAEEKCQLTVGRDKI